MPILRCPENYTHELPGARFTSLATPRRGTRTTSVWRVELSPGTQGTPHQLTHEEIFVILSGRADVRIGTDHGEAVAGDCLVVPADTPFQLQAVGDAPMTALCCFPTEGKARLENGNAFTPPWAE